MLHNFLVCKKICFNLRLLLINLTAALIIRALFTSYRAGNRIIRVFTATNSCDFVSKLFSCSLESALQTIPFAVTIYSFPVIAGERIVATIFRKFYEKKFFTFFVCLAIAANWITISSLYINSLIPVYSLNISLPFCSTIIHTNDVKYRDIFFDNQFIFPLNSIGICVGICIFCKYKKEIFFKRRFSSHSLTDRYNLSEIIKTSQIVLLLCSIFALLHILYQIFIFISILHFEVNTLKKFSVIKEISSLCVMPVFANIYGITFLFMQKKAKKVLTKFSAIKSLDEQPKPQNSVSPLTSETDTYFKMLESSWK
uniref:Vomeronasal type-1 receptor n=1 Tax=Panagrolaimus sp. PS1159 TaxID=55785 RepID=A0AC35FZE9_9BILA